MKDRVAIVGSGFHGSLATALLHSKLNKEGVEIVDLDSELLQPGEQTYLIENRFQIPELSIYGVEKKKKGPCGAHEYIERKSENGKAVWKCRHCEREL